MKLFKKLKKNRGFSLIEILCVMAIMVMLVAMAIPQFELFRDNAKRSTTVASARTTVSTIIGLTALYEKEDWYAPRNSGTPYDYSQETMSNYLEMLFEEGDEGSNMHNYKNQYSDSRTILNWHTTVSGTGEDPAVFLTNTSTFSHANANVSTMSQLEGSIIVYFDTTGTGESMITNHIEVYYTDENGIKCEKPFIIVM